MIRHQLGICYELLCISWLLSGWRRGPPRLPTQPSPPTTHLPSHCICRPSAQRSSSSAKAQLSQAWTLRLKEIMSLATCQAGGLTVEHHDTWKKSGTFMDVMWFYLKIDGKLINLWILHCFINHHLGIFQKTNEVCSVGIAPIWHRWRTFWRFHWFNNQILKIASEGFVSWE